mgnify:CR=1 FL=1
MKLRLIVILLVPLFLISSLDSVAQSRKNSRKVKNQPAYKYDNHISTNLYYMYNPSFNESQFLIGLSYKKHISDIDFIESLGATIDYTIADYGGFSLTLPVGIQPYYKTYIFVAPGIGFLKDHPYNDAGVIDEKTFEDQILFVFRVGIDFVYDYDDFTITPGFRANLADRHVSFGVGVSFGFRFGESE